MIYMWVLKNPPRVRAWEDVTNQYSSDNTIRILKQNGTYFRFSERIYSGDINAFIVDSDYKLTHQIVRL